MFFVFFSLHSGVGLVEMGGIGLGRGGRGGKGREGKGGGGGITRSMLCRRRVYSSRTSCSRGVSVCAMVLVMMLLLLLLLLLVKKYVVIYDM